MNIRTLSGPVLALCLLGACSSGETAVDAAPDTSPAPGDSGDSGGGGDGAVATMDGAAGTMDGDDLTPDQDPDSSAAAADANVPTLVVGGNARVTATALNLRTGVGTSNAIITSMPCGSQVGLLGGPSSGWWNVRYGMDMGWASGAYLIAESAFDPAICMHTDAGAATDAASAGDSGAPAMPMEISAVFDRARLGVGYSYYWGHGSWRDDGTQLGSCSGTCPSCTHTGQYGADCSGFVAKVWQIPGPSPLTTDLHPYSTYNFYNQSTHWSRVDRATIRPGDALVYNANGEGHIMLFESGSDPWGSIWTYEARGCSTGIVHNLRTAASMYVAIRREGF
jgi:hypothetical protein